MTACYEKKRGGDFRFGCETACVRGVGLSAPAAKGIVQISHKVIDRSRSNRIFSKRQRSEHVPGCVNGAFNGGSAGVKCSHLDAVWRPRVHKQRASGVLSPHNVAILSWQAWTQCSIVNVNRHTLNICCLLLFATVAAVTSSTFLGCYFHLDNNQLGSPANGTRAKMSSGKCCYVCGAEPQDKNKQQCTARSEWHMSGTQLLLSDRVLLMDQVVCSHKYCRVAMALKATAAMIMDDL